jgi:transporter family protein
MWKFYAILSAIFAALTAIFAKLGIEGINSYLATAIRTVIILAITWLIVLFAGTASGIRELTRNNWTFLVLSGATTGFSWLFYFKALQLGDLSKVAPIDKFSVVFTILLSFLILREPFSWKVLLGGCLIAAGGVVILLGK